MLADLDELVLRVRDPNARQNVEEAVRVLRTGSPRACIILTWIAVVYDVAGKLRDLSDLGDARAKVLYDEFERIRAAHDIKAALDFESKIPTVAVEMELVSPIEGQDLLRLQADRHRCAHPSQTIADSAFSPSDELARYHLRGTVEGLLQHPPSQGKVALDRVLAAIESEYFPEEISTAIARLRGGPLGRARDSLVRNAMVVLAKRILEHPLDEVSSRRRLGLQAIREMYPEQFERVAVERLRGLLGDVDEARLRWVLFVLRTVPALWRALREDSRDRLLRYVKKPPAPEANHTIALALGIESTRGVALEQLFELKRESFAAVVEIMGERTPADVERILIDRLINELPRRVKWSLTRLALLGGRMSEHEMRRFFGVVAELLSEEEHEPESLKDLVKEVIWRMPDAIAEPIYQSSELATVFDWVEMSIPF